MYNSNEFDFCQNYMTRDERIIWKGKPQNPQKMTMNDKISFFFGLFWLGFSTFWCIMASLGGGGIWIFGLFFVAIGVYIAFILPFVNVYKRKHTCYVITNEKIMCREINKVLAMERKEDLRMNIFGNANEKTATIYFGEKIVYYKNGRTRTRYSGSFPLINVPLKEVQDAIGEMQREDA